MILSKEELLTTKINQKSSYSLAKKSKEDSVYTVRKRYGEVHALIYFAQSSLGILRSISAGRYSEQHESPLSIAISSKFVNIKIINFIKIFSTKNCFNII